MKSDIFYPVLISFVLTVLIICPFETAGADGDILLGITWQDSLLVSFDPYEGTVFQVHAQLNPNESFRGLSYDSGHDMLYALSQVAQNLYSIDPVTMEIRHIGNLHTPCSNTDIGGLTYNSDNDTFYTTLSNVNGDSSDLLSINVNNASVTNLGNIAEGYCFSPSYNPDDGRIYGFVLYGSGDWKSPYKSRVVSINPANTAMINLFETPYHTILGLAKKPGENIFYSWVNWTTHFYGEIHPDTETIISLGTSDSIGVASDAMIYKDFYVGVGSLLPTEEAIVSFDFIGRVSQVQDPNRILGGAVTVGDTFSGEFSYDINLLYSEAIEPPQYEISVKIGSRRFTFSELSVGITNNFYDCYEGNTSDSFYLNAETDDDDTGSISLSIALTDYSAQALENNIFLPDRFDLPAWDKIDFYMFSSNSEDLPGFSIRGILNEIISDVDSDGDGVPDHSDNCPDDPEKTQPGVCGCGFADSNDDSDRDGTLDCNDSCPDDPGKTEPGVCGCGIADADSDRDGTEDCFDGCTEDPDKTWPGECGCGVADTDRDGDGTKDCRDLCPDNPGKIEPGACGCSVPDSDADGDGIPDCEDANDDNDGMPDAGEYGPDGTDPDYDGNGDSIPDSVEDHVVSFHSFDDKNYLTLESSDGTSISNCSATENPSPSMVPEAVMFLYGFFEMTIEKIDAGGASVVKLHLPPGNTIDTYYKFGPTPDNMADHWYEFLYDGQTGAEINGTFITLHFIDGMRGDDDLLVNGIISDAGGPGISLNNGSGNESDSGGGGCFISPAAKVY